MAMEKSTPQRALPISPINIFMLAAKFLQTSYNTFNAWYFATPQEITYRWQDTPADEVVNFLEHEVDGSGADCAFIALGVTRAQAIQELLTRDQDANTRRLLAPDLLAVLIDPDDREALPETLEVLRLEFREHYNELQNYIEGVRGELNYGRVDQLTPLQALEVLRMRDDCRYDEYKRALDEFEVIQIRRQQYEHSITPEEFRTFVEFQFGKRHGYLSYMYGGGGALEALARLLRVNVQIFIADARHRLIRTLNVEVTNPRNGFYLLHTGTKNDRGRVNLNHFNLLERIPVPAQTNAAPSGGVSSPKVVAQPPWHEDALSSGEIVLTDMIFKGFNKTDPTMMNLAFSSQKKATDFNLQLLRILSPVYPSAALQIMQDQKLPREEIRKLQTEMLKQVSKRYKDIGASELADLFAHHAESSKQKDELREAEYEKLCSKYYELVFSIIRDSESDSKKQRDLWEKFEELHALRPNAIEPYIPLITFMSGRLEQETLRKFLHEAYDIDPYKTYAYCFYHLRLAGSGLLANFFQRSNPVQLIPLLKELYPNDAFVRVLQVSVSDPGTVEFAESELTQPLLLVQRNFQDIWAALAQDQTQKAIEDLIRLEPSIGGFAFVHRYLALVWLLQGDMQKAWQIYKRANNLPSLPNGNSLDACRGLGLYWQILAKATNHAEILPNLLDYLKPKSDPLHALFNF